MSQHPIVNVQAVTHRFGDRIALADVSFDVPRGVLFGMLGPNGSGKTTLFRIITTLIAPSSGTVLIDGNDVATHADEARRRFGVVFQKPALDGKLTVLENLMHQGRLFGMGGATLKDRCRALLKSFGVDNRAADRTETLSGGLQRRVELAKSLLHEPALLILDEPSTGLDPGARRNLMDQLRSLCAEGITCLMTSHLMEDAERCNTVGILDAGRLVALDTPDNLKRIVGGDVISLRAKEPDQLMKKLQDRFDCHADVIDGVVRIERPEGHNFIPHLIEAFPGEIDSVTTGKPTLEDVFVHLTGHSLE